MNDFYMGLVWGFVDGGVIAGIITYKLFLDYTKRVETHVGNTMKELNDQFKEFMDWRKENGRE